MGTTVGANNVLISYPIASPPARDCLVAAHCGGVEDVRLFSHPPAVALWQGRVDVSRLRNKDRALVDTRNAVITCLTDYAPTHSGVLSLLAAGASLDQLIVAHTGWFGEGSCTVVALRQLVEEDTLQIWFEEAFGNAGGNKLTTTSGRADVLAAWAAAVVVERFNIAYASWHRRTYREALVRFNATEVCVTHMDSRAPPGVQYRGSSVGMPSLWAAFMASAHPTSLSAPPATAASTTPWNGHAPAASKPHFVPAAVGAGGPTAPKGTDGGGASGGVEVVMGTAVGVEVTKALADIRTPNHLWTRRNPTVFDLRWQRGGLCFNHLRWQTCDGNACTRKHVWVVGGKWSSTAGPAAVGTPKP